MRLSLVVFAFALSVVGVSVLGSSVFAADTFAKPVVTSASPSSALNTGGDTVTITGSAFAEGAVVRFDDVVASSVNYVNESTLTATVPVSKKFGVVSLSVTNADAQVSDPARVFSYIHVAPQITTVTPDSGRTTGGQQVTITGSGFYYDLEFSSIVAANSHTCGIAWGEAYCWGVNSSGQLGDGSTANSVVPVKVVQQDTFLKDKVVTALSVDNSSACALASGEVYCWGNGGQGRLGSGSNASSLVPVKVAQIAGALQGKAVEMIKAGSNGHVCAVVVSGELYCWGNNANGQLGIGSTTSVNVPTKVNGALLDVRVTDISLGSIHTCAVSDGSTFCWGNNGSGQLGVNSTTQYATPVRVTQSAGLLQGKVATKVAVGSNHSCVIASSEAYCWGLNANNQLGNGGTAQSTVPVKVSLSTGGLLGKQLSQISSSSLHTCAVADGEAYCWGASANGRLGAGGAAGATPVQVTQAPGILLGKTIDTITAGGQHTCATASQRVYCWGNNANGVFGNGAVASSTTPIDATPSLPLPLEVSIAGVKRGITTQTPSALTFVTPAHAAGSVDVSVGSEFVATATRAAGFTYSPPVSLSSVTPSIAYNGGGDVVTITGENFGDAPTVHFGGARSTSVTRASPTTLQAVVPSSVAIGTVDITVTNDDTATAKLPRAFTYAQQAPIVTSVDPVRGPTAGRNAITLNGSGFYQGMQFAKITSGDAHSCGLDFTGKIYCWGNNSDGQLGNNSTVNSSAPVMVDMSGVLSSKTITNVAAGASHTAALDSEGKVYAWGNNTAGRLGNATTTSSSVPVSVVTTGALAGKVIMAIAAGGSHTMALDSEGKVYAWGSNGLRQVGTGSAASSFSSPVAVDTSGQLAGKTITAISAGANHSMALDSDGKAYGWGININGTVGNGTTSSTVPAPVAVSTAGVLAGKIITAISAGANHTLALDSEGKVYAWGASSNGQRGNGTTSGGGGSPVEVLTTGVLAGKTVTSIAASTSFSVAIDSQGAAYSWGLNANGQLGIGSRVQNTAPVAVPATGVLAGKAITSITTGTSYTMALDSEGGVYTWGDNTSGQLGDGSLVSSDSPLSLLSSIAIPFVVTIGGTEVEAIRQTETTLSFIAPSHAIGSVDIVLSSPGVDTRTLANAYEYVAPPQITSVSPNSGYNSGGDTIVISGQDFLPAPVVTIGGIAAVNVTRVNSSTITATVPASRTTGSVSVVVTNSDGQRSTLTGGFTYTQESPVVTSVDPLSGPVAGGNKVTLNGSGFYQGLQFTQVTSGASHSCGLTATGKVYCWGANTNGQLGNNSTLNTNTPAAVDTTGVLAGKTVVAVAAGQNYVIALDSRGAVYAWGSNSSNELGDGSTVQSATPVAVATTGVLAGKTIVAIAAGDLHALALDSDGYVYGWGSNTQGQLGNNSTTQAATPVAVTTTGVLAGKTITAISTGQYHASALATDGVVYGWGYNAEGQLGDNSTSRSTVPVAVTTTGVLAGKTITAISAGYRYTVALDTDGRAYGWGHNVFGQLGNTSTSNSTVPVAVTTTGVLAGKTITAISAGQYSTTALDGDGKVYSWGQNSNGQLGNGTTTQSTVPVSVDATGLLAGKTITAISAGRNYAAALESSGRLYAWGQNGNGQLGNNSVAQSTVPVETSSDFATSFTLVVDGSPVAINQQTETSLSYTAPAHAKGMVDIQLSASGYDALTLRDAYEYVAPPTLTSITPNTGLKSGGDTVTLTGNDFSANPTVRIGGQLATNVVRVNSSTLTATTPAVPLIGAADVNVQNSDGQQVTLPSSFTYRNAAPAIVSVAPSQGPTAGGNTVTITGTNFADQNSTTNTWSNTGKTITGGTYGAQLAVVGSKVYMFGGYNTNIILSADVSDPTTWTNTGKTLPGALYGSQLAVVGSKMYLFGGFGSSAIFSADVSDPTTWTNTGKTLPSALGYSQLATVGSKLYLFGGINSRAIFSADVSDPTTWTNTGKMLPELLGYSQVAVIGSNVYLFGGNNSSGGAAASHRNTIYSATTSDPTTWANTGRTLPVGLALSQVGVIGDTVYLFGGALSTGGYTNATFSAPVSDPLSWTNTGKTLPGAQGISHFAVINSNMYLFAGVGAGSNIIYSAPATYGEPNVSNKSWITNWQTASDESSTSPLEIRIGGTLATNVKLVSSTTITATAPAGVPGLADVSLRSSDGQTAALTNGYEYLGPRITNVSPAKGSTLGGDTLTITGSRFVQDGTTPPKVLIGGIEATSVEFISSTELRVVSPVHAAGVVGVTVENYDGESATLASAYTYVRPPIVQSVSPSQGLTSGGDTVTIIGTDFDETATVSFGTVAATQVAYVNSTTLTAVSPAHYVGPVSVSVTNSDGQVSALARAFTYIGIPPTITSVTPAFGPVAGGTQVTIAGSGFDLTYKRPVTVANTTGQAISSGKALVRVDTAALISAGKMRTDGGDMRFVDETGQQLRYWIESGLNTATTNVWVDVPTVAVGGAVVYMTYGVPSATGQSDPSLLEGNLLDPNFTAIALNAQELYVPFSGHSQNVCKSWSVPGGGLINEFTATHATESGYDFFVVTADGTQRYRGSGNATQVVSLPTPVRTLTACLTTDTSGQAGYGGQVSAVKGQQIQGALSSTVGAEARGAQVYFGDQLATVTQLSATQIRASSPAHLPGRVDVSVVNPYTEPVTRTGGFTYIANFAFSNAPLNLSATEPGKLTIESRDANGQPATSTTPTEIMLSSSSSGGFFARDIEEDSATRWDYTSVILPAGQSSVDVWYRDSTQGTPTITGKVENIVTFTQLQTIGSRYKLQVTGISDPIQVGVPSSVTVRVVDFSGVPQTGYTGTIRFSSGDQAALLPANYAMRPSDNGIKTFVNGVTMRTQGEFCVSAADTGDALISGQQCGISVLPPNQGTITQLAIISSEQSFPSNGYSSPITVQAQDANGRPIAVNANTPVYLYSNSSTGEFRTVGQEAWSASKPYVATIEAGLTSVNVQYRDGTARTSTLSARDVTTDTADNGLPGDFGWKNATQAIISGVGAPTKLSVSGPTRLPASERGAYVVQIQDEDGNPVTAESDITIRIDGTTTSSSFYLSSDPQATPLSGPIEFVVAGGTHQTTIWFSDSVSSEPGEFTTLNLTDARPETESVRLSDASYDVTIGLGDPLKLRVSEMTEASVRKNAAVHVDMLDEFGNITYYDGQTTNIALSSSLDGAFSSSQLTVSPGQTGASTTYYGLEDGDHTITAANQALESGTAQLAVTPITLAFMPLASTSADEPIAIDVVVRNQAGDTITLDAPQTTIAFATSAPSGSFNPASTTLAAGAQQVSTSYLDTEVGARTLQAQSPHAGINPATLSMTVTPGEYAQYGDGLRFSTPEQQYVAGEPKAFSVGFYDKKGRLTTLTSDVVLSLASSSNTGSFSLASSPFTPVTTVTVPAGSQTIELYYRDETAGAPTLSVADTALPNSENQAAAWTEQEQEVIAAAPARVEIDSETQLIAINTASAPISFVLKDSFGNDAVAAQNMTLNVTSNSTQGEFAVVEYDGGIEQEPSNWQQTKAITIVAGARTAEVFYRDSTAGIHSVTGAIAGIASGSQTIEVVLGFPEKAVVTANELSVVAGESSAFTVALQMEDGTEVAPASRVNIQLSVSDGEVSLTETPFVPISSLAFERGVSRQTIFFRSTSVGTSQITATGFNVQTSDTIEVLPAEFARFGITPLTSSLPIDTASDAMTVTMYDIFGNVAASDSDTTAYFHSNESTTQFATSPAGSWDASSITLPAGATSQNFYAKDTAFHDEAVQITVSDFASLDQPDVGIENGTAELTIVSQRVSTIAFTSAGRTLVAGESSEAITFELLKADGTPAVQDGTTRVLIGTPQGEGRFTLTQNPSAESITNILVARGESTATVYYTGTKSGTFTAQASIQAAVATQPITVTPASFAVTQYTTLEQSITADGPSGAIRVVFQDEYENQVALTNETTFTLETTCSDTGSFSETNAPFTPVASIQAPVGAQDLTFYYKDTQAGQCTIRVSTPGVETASQLITVTAGAPVTFDIVGSSSTLVKGQSATVVVNLLDAFGNIAQAARSTTAAFTTTSSTGQFSQQTALFVTGQSTRSITYVDSVAGTATVRVEDQAALLDGDSKAFTFTEGEPTAIRITPNPSTMRAGATQSLQVTLVNDFGVAVEATQDMEISLMTNAGSGRFLETAASDAPTIQTIQVREGESQAAVFYTQTTSGATTLSAQYDQMSGSAQLTVLPKSVHEMRFTNPIYIDDQALEIGEPGAISVRLYDEYGNIAVTDTPLVLYASSDATDGTFANNGRIVIGAGASQGVSTFAVNTPGSYTVSIADSPNGASTSGLSAVQQSVDVIYGDATTFKFSPTSVTLERGGVTDQMNAVLYNRYDRVVPAGVDGREVTLDMREGTGAFSESANGTFTPTLLLSFAEGESSRPFFYRNDDAQIENRSCATNADGTRTCYTSFVYTHTIRGTGGPGLPVSRSLSVNMKYGDPVRLAFTTPERAQPAQHPSQVLTVQQVNQYGKPVVTHSDVQLFVRSSSGLSGEFGSTTTNWGVNRVTLLNSASSVSFYYRDKQVGAHTLTVADSLPITQDTGRVNATQQITIQPQVVDNFLVTNISDPQAQGTPSSVVVIARDAEGYTVESYDGLVTFSSDDQSAILPSSYTFNPAVDKGSKTFTNGVAFRSPGEKTVRVTDEAGITGSQNDITVTGANTAPVAEVAFSQPASPMETIRGAASPAVTVQLRDSTGTPTTAGESGYAVRLTTSSPTARFAMSPNGPWVSSLVTSVPEGLSYLNFYYRDTALGSAQVLVSDWNNGVNNPDVLDSALEVITRTIRIEGENSIQSRNAFGQFEESTSLFAHNAAGAIVGKAQNDFSSFSLENGAANAVDWRLQWRQGVTLLQTTSVQDRDTANLTVDPIQTTAGRPDFYAIAEATTTTFDIPSEVVSRQLTIPTSPWRTAATPSAEYAKQDVEYPFTVTTRNNAALAGAATTAIQVLRADATDASEPLYGITVNGGNGQIAGTLPADLLELGEYRLFATAYDVDGNTIAQDLSGIFTVVEVIPEPETPVDPGTEVPGGETPTNPGVVTPGTVAPPSTQQPTPGVDQPEEVIPEEETPAGEGEPVAPGVVENNDQDGGVWQSIKEFLQSPNAATIISGALASVIGLIIVALIYQAYKEWRQAQWLLAIIKRDQQTVADKDAFLNLAAHYLRTPMSLIDSGASILQRLQSDEPTQRMAAALQGISNGMRAKIESILAQTTNAQNLETITAPTTGEARTKILLSPIFWVPVILSIVLSLIANWMIGAVGGRTVAGQQVMQQFFIIVLAGILLYTAVRLVTMRRERNRKLEESREKVRVLNAVRMNFVQQTYQELSDDVLHLSAQDTSRVQNEAVRTAVNEGTNRLKELVSRFAILSSVRPEYVHAKQFNMHELVDDALRDLSEKSRSSLRINNKIAELELIQDEHFLAKVMSTILESISGDSKLHDVNIEGHQSKSGTTTVTLKSQFTGALGAPGEELFSIYSDEGNEAAATYDAADGTRRLDLYLDRMIMSQLGGEIKTQRTRNSFEVQLTMPSQL